MLQLKSSGSVKTISLNRTEVIKALEIIASRIHDEHPEVKSIRLFGSIATGDHVGTSDADILIILNREAACDFLESIRLFYGYFKLPIPVDVLVYNEDQIAKRLQSGDTEFERILGKSLELLGGQATQ